MNRRKAEKIVLKRIGYLTKRILDRKQKGLEVGYDESEVTALITILGLEVLDEKQEDDNFGNREEDRK